jgi:predicted ATPase
MSRIKIQNFGPITDGYLENDGWLEINKTTVFTGNQGTGKSTIAKLISIFTWIEKSLTKEDTKLVDYTQYNRFRKIQCAYQNIHNYFKDSTVLEYDGDSYEFTYQNNIFSANKKRTQNKYFLPKIMYVPAERSFISVVLQPEKIRNLPAPLATFLDEYERSKNELKEPLQLPINNLKFNYDKKKKSADVIGTNHSTKLTEASSGLQSIIPLYLVTKNLAEGIDKEGDYSKERHSIEEKKRIRDQLFKLLDESTHRDSLPFNRLEIENIFSVSKNDCFINIVEEPELSLFPTSQRGIINILSRYSNLNEYNKLIITTHSPYVINYLTLAAKAYIINQLKLTDDEYKKLYAIVPHDSLLQPEQLIVYETCEDGSIKKLPSYYRLPSDDNFLNNDLARFNDLFSDLLDIEVSYV